MDELNFVIDSVTGKILRWGYCNFAEDGMLDGEIEEVIISKDRVHPDCNTKREDRYYDKTDDTIKTSLD